MLQEMHIPYVLICTIAMFYLEGYSWRDLVPLDHIVLVWFGVILKSSPFSIVYNWSPDVFHAVKQFGCTNNSYEIMAN